MFFEDNNSSGGILTKTVVHKINSKVIPQKLKPFHGPVLVDVMNKRQKVAFYFLSSVWLLGLLILMAWWFQPNHVISWSKFILTTILILWSMGLPGYFYFFVARMQRVNPEIEIPAHWRIAMVVTKAPSEPFTVVKKTLEAMLGQKHPHDTWLADEDPTEEVIRWCAKYQVKISTRKGVTAYHKAEWPRRTKCKEGNLAYFYDKYGYEKYDFVVQLDADHVPGENYLEAMIKPFILDSTGYVSAPSICNANENSSWAARGRLFAESSLHGPLQAGHSNEFAPLCIGSHYAIRTKALKEIGGLGPELAEDHSTTLIMNGHGWKGIHAFDAYASGDGPETFGDCITQEFQWSRSLTILLFTLTPKYWSKLPSRLKFQFLFSQLWYPLNSLIFLLGHLLPIYAILSKEPIVAVSYLDFIIHSIPVTLSILAIVWFLKRNHWLRPINSPIFSWEALLFNMARWPWTLYGCFMGVLAVVTRRQTAFKVTPKGIEKPQSVSWNILYPYLAICLVSFLPSIFISDAGIASGYYYFLILNVVLYLTIISSIILMQLNEARTKTV